MPFAAADIFVDRKDSRIFWNVQHFGIQNKPDPQLDEWIQMDSFTRKPGRLDPARGLRAGLTTRTTPFAGGQIG